ncbi:HlyD family secretion protein [Chitinophaga sp. G-6-1-13]|uniref:HlyD family secretion protein n=1 Tax=Chitinophaga fulva TaxID=2728842 RepID=A0A848GX59_9BACT|nr:HlyD family secretion protein [Chitinophaga fulva]NML41310.1 HlyD family secretion protein [Chitinophaga fulva]
MEENRKKRKMLLPVVLLAVAAAGIIIGINRYQFYRTHEETDDAQIDGDLSVVVSRAGGYIDSIYFEDNQRVIKDQLLIKLEDREYHLKLEQAMAAHKLANSRIDVATTQVATSEAASSGYKAEVEAAKAKLWQAEQDFSRYTVLVAKGAVPRQQYDQAKTTRDAAAATYAAASGQYNAAIEQISNHRSQLQVTHTAVSREAVDIDYAQLMLSYTHIAAPVTGLVTKRKVQPGQLVQPGQTLFSVVDENSLYVTANFKETQLTHMHPGQPVKIRVDAYPDMELSGTVHNFAATTGAKVALLPPDNATGNFVKVVQRIPVKIKLQTADTTLHLLRPGMNVEVTVNTR